MATQPTAASSTQGPERRLQGFVSLAHTLCDMGRPAEAEEMCRWVLAQHPRLTSARIAFGRALLEGHKPAEAAIALRMAARELPGSFAAHQWLAEALLEDGALTAARAALAQAAVLSPESPRVAWLGTRLVEDGGHPAADGPSAVAVDPASTTHRVTAELPPASWVGAEPQRRDDAYGPDDITPVTKPLPVTDAGPVTGRRRSWRGALGVLVLVTALGALGALSAGHLRDASAAITRTVTGPLR